VAGYTGTIGATGRTKAVLVSSSFFLAGMVISMTIIGAIIGYASEMISGSVGMYWKIIAGVFSIVFGLYSMDLLPFSIPGISINVANKGNGIFGAVVFGLAVGGVSALTSICCSPFFPVIMAASFVKGSTLWGTLMMLFYALGYGLILALAMAGVGFGLGKLSKSLTQFARVLKYAAGILLVVLGFYFLFTF
jgi:cytochrome c-type biogenesis protein